MGGDYIRYHYKQQGVGEVACKDVSSVNTCISVRICLYYTYNIKFILIYKLAYGL